MPLLINKREGRKNRKPLASQSKIHAFVSALKKKKKPEAQHTHTHATTNNTLNVSSWWFVLFLRIEFIFSIIMSTYLIASQQQKKDTCCNDDVINI
jgi:hypothetical protein